MNAWDAVDPTKWKTEKLDPEQFAKPLVSPPTRPTPLPQEDTDE